MTSVRILHVVGALNRGGVETWLLHVLRRIDRNRFRFDFLVHTDREAAYDAEARSLGAEIIPCTRPQRLWSYLPKLRHLLRTRGPYDVVHSNVHHFSGFVLAVARSAGVPIRIAHSHNDTRSMDQASSPLRGAYLSLGRSLIRQGAATLRIAASCDAGAALFGEPVDRWQVLYYGIDLDDFGAAAEDPQDGLHLAVRRRRPVLVHVGRFVPQKNHRLLVEIAEVLRDRGEMYTFLLIGDGPLRAEVEEQVKSAGLDDYVRFLGEVADVPRWLLGVADVFVFPSLFEGLGLALIEAQAAGVPCVVSERVPREADVIPALIERLSPADGAAVWADTILRVHRRGRPISSPEAAERIRRSSFTIDSSVRSLTDLYTSQWVPA